MLGEGHSVIRDDIRSRTTMSRDATSPPPANGHHSPQHGHDPHTDGVLVEPEESDDVVASSPVGAGHQKAGEEEWILLDHRPRDSAHYVAHPTIFDFETTAYSRQELEESFEVHLVGKYPARGAATSSANPAAKSAAHRGAQHHHPQPQKPLLPPPPQIDPHLEILNSPLVHNVTEEQAPHLLVLSGRFFCSSLLLFLSPAPPLPPGPEGHFHGVGAGLCHLLAWHQPFHNDREDGASAGGLACLRKGHPRPCLCSLLSHSLPLSLGGLTCRFHDLGIWGISHGETAA